MSPTANQFICTKTNTRHVLVNTIKWSILLRSLKQESQMVYDTADEALLTELVMFRKKSHFY